MKTFQFRFRGLVYLSFLATLILNVKVISAQEGLAPDQNPNYKKSQDKYMALKDSLTKNEGTTVQATYKAIDDMQLKQERKDLRRSNRQDRRMARINNRGYYYGSPYYNNNSIYYNSSRYPYGYNYGYNNYGYGNYGYGNGNYGYNYGYGNCSRNYSPYYYNSSCGFNRLGNAALWGLGAYLLFR